VDRFFVSLPSFKLLSTISLVCIPFLISNMDSGDADTAAAAAPPAPSSRFATPVDAIPSLFRQDSVATASFWMSQSKVVSAEEYYGKPAEAAAAAAAVAAPDAEKKPKGTPDQTVRDSAPDISGVLLSGKFSDCVVVCNGVRHAAHRCDSSNLLVRY
jgi:hypothetical protein